MANQEVISGERWAPNAELEAAWKSIVVPDDVKNRLLRHTPCGDCAAKTGVLRLRASRLHRADRSAGHRQTTLAEGLASAVVPFVADRRVRLLTVDHPRVDERSAWPLTATGSRCVPQRDSVTRR